jgi:polyhydroxybutyrate depolymerase
MLPALLLLVSCRESGASGGDSGLIDAGDFAETMVHHGLTRTFLYHIPPGASRDARLPVVLVLHGGGGSASAAINLTEGGFNDLADTEGFIAIYPQGTPEAVGNAWSAGGAYDPTADDVGFLLALLDHFEHRFNTDPGRIYACGMSNGAAMCYRLALEAAGRFAAIAAVGNNLYVSYATATPVARVPMLVMGGTADPLVPWEGGTISFLGIPSNDVVSAAATVAFWASHNGCSATPVVEWLPDTDPADGTRVWTETYAPNSDGRTTVLVGVLGGGHMWPGGAPTGPEWLYGKMCRDIDACQVLWDFFRPHVR